MKYDIIFILPCTLIDQYKYRLDIFKKYGLININNVSIKTLLIINKNDNIEDEIFKNWEYDIEVIQGYYEHISPKTYDFFANQFKTYINDAKWFIKIDDDSITNVKDLFSYLSLTFNNDEPVYIIPTGKHRYMEEIYKDLFFKHKMFKYMQNQKWAREFEISIFSNSSAKLLYKNNKTIKFLEDGVRKGDRGHNDALLCPACYESGSEIIFDEVASWYPKWDDFLNEKYLHIHKTYQLPEKLKDMISANSYAKIKYAYAKNIFKLKSS